MANKVEINLTEDDIQQLMDAVQTLEEDDNNHVFTWNYEDANGEPIEVVITVGDDPE